MEEPGRRFEQELEILENEPSYMRASWEKFSNNPKDIDAKRLWLKYTKLGEEVPENVTKQMIAIIKKQVEDHEINQNPDTHNRQWNENKLYELLHIAKTDLDYFWQILLEPQAVKFLCLYGFDDCVLDILRIWLPDRKKLKSSELYSIFEALMNGDDPKPDGPPYVSIYIDQRYRKRYPKNK